MARRKRGTENSGMSLHQQVLSQIAESLTGAFDKTTEAIVKLNSQQNVPLELINNLRNEFNTYKTQLEQRLDQLVQNQPAQPQGHSDYNEIKTGIDAIGENISRINQGLEYLRGRIDERDRQPQQPSDYNELREQISGLRSTVENLGRVIDAQRNTQPQNYDELRRMIEGLRNQINDQARQNVQQPQQPVDDRLTGWAHDRIQNNADQIGENRGRVETLSDILNNYVASEAARQQQAGQQPPVGAGGQPPQPPQQYPIRQSEQQAGQQPPVGAGGQPPQPPQQPPAQVPPGQQPPQQPPRDTQGEQPQQPQEQQPAQDRQQARQEQQRRPGQRRAQEPRIPRREELTLDKLADEYNQTDDLPLPHIRTHHRYPLDKISVATYEEFRQELIKYEKHHQRELFNTVMSDETAFARAQQILQATFEKQGGFLGAYKKARQGRLGDIINALANAEAGQCVATHQTYVLKKVDPLDWDTHVKLAREFKIIYGNFVPSDMQQQSVEQLATGYEGLITYHAEKKQEVKELLERYEPVSRAA